VTLAKWGKQAVVPVGDVSHAPAVLSVEGRTHDVKVCNYGLELDLWQQPAE